MQEILEIYGDYRNEGIINRKVTEGREIELVREYIEYRKDQFMKSSNTEDRRLAVFLEPKVDNAYPDIVFVEYNPENYTRWKPIRNDLLKDDIKILYHLYATGGQNAADLVSQLGVTWKETIVAIEKLYDAELVTRIGKKWSINDITKISTYNIEAVEAKLDKWDQLLQQSIINKNFASESYILSIARSAAKMEILDRFTKFGIGVYLKDGESFNIVKQAKKIQIPASFNSIFFNEWIGRVLNAREQM